MSNTEIATFGAGCFWGVEETFLRTKGVTKTRVGYTGGTTKDPTYWDVASGHTRHAEAAEVMFDPSIISYEELLKIFWDNHDPTQKNRQGPDVGDEYRSAIFYHSEGQRTTAEASKAAMEKSGRYTRPIVTEIVPAMEFYPAEEVHQQYLRKRGLDSCHV